MTIYEAIELVIEAARQAKPVYDRGTPCSGIAALSFVWKMFPVEYDAVIARFEDDEITADDYLREMLALIAAYAINRQQVMFDRLLDIDGSGRKVYRGHLFAFDYVYMGESRVLPHRPNPWHDHDTNVNFIPPFGAVDSCGIDREIAKEWK